MTSPDPDRRRTILALAAGLIALTGCGDTDSETPEPAPPPDDETPTRTEPGPGPDEPSPAMETPHQGTGTPVPDDVVFSKPGGGEVAATRYGTGDCGVVLVPQRDRDRQSWDQYARRLDAAGFQALAIDEGEQDKAAGVLAAVRYLRAERAADPVVVIGASVGGEAAIEAAAQDSPTIDGVVVLSPAGGEVAAETLVVPVLVLVAADDQPYTAVAEQIAGGVPGGSDLVTYAGEAHGQELLASDHADAVRSRILTFLQSVCAPERS